jgi:hypothetical protein
MGLSWMATEFFRLPPNTPPLFNDNQIFFQSPKKAWGEGHEMTIITKGRGKLSGKKNWKQAMKARGKY